MPEVDASTQSGIHYYRIRQTGLNGYISYSEVKKVGLKRNLQIAVWPNPVNDLLTISAPNSNENAGYSATLYDDQGRRITHIRLHAGINTINIEKLMPGRYMVLVQDKYSMQYIEKIVKQ